MTDPLSPGPGSSAPAAGPPAPVPGSSSAAAGSAASSSGSFVASAPGSSSAVAGSRAVAAGSTPILEAAAVGFAYRGGGAALTDVSLAVHPGRNVALVGESGAGKTTLLRLLLGLTTPTSGEIRYAGSPLTRNRLRDYRRAVQAVFQDPYSSLDPRHRIGRIVAEPLRGLGLGTDPSRVAEALDAVGLPADTATRYPHEFSGGQRQRIAIARAIVCHPRVLLADEPVSALDLTTRVRVVDLLASLCADRDLTVLLVSHDLGVVAELCAHTAVLESGRLVEQGDTRAVLGAPTHPYTRRLLASVPRLPAP